MMKTFTVFLCGLAIVLLLRFFLPTVPLAIEILIFCIAVCANNLLLGVTGLLSFSQGVFFGVGAYVSGLALLHLGVGSLTALGLGALGGAGAAIFVGLIAIRRQGVYFVVLTFALAQTAFFLMLSLRRWTGGENGITNIPRPAIQVPGFGVLHLNDPSSLYVLVSVIFVLGLVILQRALRSPLGTALAAIRESEARAQVVGYNTFGFKLAAFMFSGLLTGVAGALYTLFLGFVSPNTIDMEVGERIVIMNIIGGTGSFFGPVVGVIVYTLAAEILSQFWARWLMLAGAALIVLTVAFPSGIWGGIERLYGRVTAYGRIKSRERG